MNQQRTQVSVASLTDSQQAIFTAATVLSWREIQPGCHVPDALELPATANGIDQGRGNHRAYAVDL